ncbi:retrotransposon protein [Cucumis melo var. makuwa]|uniref:Retrotransposon protein n=1 Tax=Cucumis melo var. makuwa TaxID=1194695 RepID=A0A5D3DTH7_CUCMM|nr:retrotransposon protein [Cucumis melo var. makuwa]
MAQKEWEDRLDMNEKEIKELKGMMLSILKSMENLSEKVKESSRAKLREESCASNGFGPKGKVKIGETDMTLGFAKGSSDKSKYKKLKIPVFSGENPESWTYQAEHNFDINELADEEKVKVAIVSFGEDTVNWFRWSNNRKKVMSWEDLKRRMFKHFKAPEEGSLEARHIRIKQDGLYADYLKKFLEYSAPLPEMAESVLIDAFIIGLETNLQAEVKGRHPVTLEACMREAQMVSDRDLAIKLALNDWRSRGPAAAEAQAQKGNQVTLNLEKKKGKRPDFAMKQISIPIKGNFAKGEPLVKRLSNSEYRARLDKELCFRCNNKYSPGHRCKVVRSVRGRKVIILSESGATHNFIHQGIVEELALPLEGKTKFGVTIGNGTTLKGKGICKKVEVKLSELTTVADFLVIELGRIDLVLGMQWLSTTRFMGIHWPSMTMVFMAWTTQVVLKGDPSLTKAECSLKTISKTWAEEDQ